MVRAASRLGRFEVGPGKPEQGHVTQRGVRVFLEDFVHLCDGVFVVLLLVGVETGDENLGVIGIHAESRMPAMKLVP